MLNSSQKLVSSVLLVIAAASSFVGCKKVFTEALAQEEGGAATAGAAKKTKKSAWVPPFPAVANPAYVADCRAAFKAASAAGASDAEVKLGIAFSDLNEIAAASADVSRMNCQQAFDHMSKEKDFGVGKPILFKPSSYFMNWTVALSIDPDAMSWDEYKKFATLNVRILAVDGNDKGYPCPFSDSDRCI